VEQIFRRSENTYGGDSPELSVVRQLQEITGTNLQAAGRRPSEESSTTGTA
jgi:hypothetical protein